MLCNSPTLTPIGHVGSLLHITMSNTTQKENKPQFASLLSVAVGR